MIRFCIELNCLRFFARSYAIEPWVANARNLSAIDLSYQLLHFFLLIVKGENISFGHLGFVFEGWVADALAPADSVSGSGSQIAVEGHDLVIGQFVLTKAYLASANEIFC